VTVTEWVSLSLRLAGPGPGPRAGAGLLEVGPELESDGTGGRLQVGLAVTGGVTVGLRVRVGGRRGSNPPGSGRRPGPGPGRSPASGRLVRTVQSRQRCASLPPAEEIMVVSTSGY
jgi:hypothetical protein